MRRRIDTRGRIVVYPTIFRVSLVVVALRQTETRGNLKLPFVPPFHFWKGEWGTHCAFCHLFLGLVPDCFCQVRIALLCHKLHPLYHSARASSKIRKEVGLLHSGWHVVLLEERRLRSSACDSKSLQTQWRYLRVLDVEKGLQSLHDQSVRLTTQLPGSPRSLPVLSHLLVAEIRYPTLEHVQGLESPGDHPKAPRLKKFNLTIDFCTNSICDWKPFFFNRIVVFKKFLDWFLDWELKMRKTMKKGKFRLISRLIFRLNFRLIFEWQFWWWKIH